jgi:hypothetical protein
MSITLNKQHLDFIDKQCLIEDEGDAAFAQGHSYSYNEIPSSADTAVGIAVKYAKRLWNSLPDAMVTILITGNKPYVLTKKYWEEKVWIWGDYRSMGWTLDEGLQPLALCIAEKIVDKKGVIVWMNVR